MSHTLSPGLHRAIRYGSLAIGGSVLGTYYYHQFPKHRLESSPHLRGQGERERQMPGVPTMATPKDLPSWQATFAVPMHCQSCVNEIESTVRPLAGVKSVETNLANKTITIDSTLPPSTIQRALASINRDAILRGSGLPNSAAVAILETYDPDVPKGTSPVRGLVRMVQVREDLVLCDVGVSNLGTNQRVGSPQGTWAASIRQTGDLSQGPLSTGSVWSDQSTKEANGTGSTNFEQQRGFLGIVEVDATGKGSAVLLKEKVPIWELIGRGLVLEKIPSTEPGAFIPTPDATPGSEAVVGVIARSAGVWDNDKTVCSCSGKTVWEEREEQRGRGML